MSMRFHLLTTLILVFQLLTSKAQTDSAKLSDQYYREGMEAFNFSHRKQAVDLFELAVKTNPKNVKASLMAGKSIMSTIHKEKSLPYFKKAYSLDKNADEDLMFLIGQAYHYNEQFDSALWYYEKFNTLLSKSLKFGRVIKINEVNWKIFECRNAMVFKANPVGAIITDLDENINSEWPDYAPTVSADESTMIFTSRRPENNGNPSLAEDLEFYEEILISKRENGKWQKAKKIDELNSLFHDASVSLSPDGKEMFVYSDDNGGDIYETDLQPDKTWSAPKRMNGFINSPYLENSAAISADGKKLFFVSDRPGGYGGTDVYVAFKNKRGDWSDVLNLGPVVNTERDEEDVFTTVNGQHLYFSSNGHAGMGDLDIYRSEFDSAKMIWSEPLNLGYPINSVENDIYFVMTGDEKYAYISSMRSESKGEQDIYKVDLTNWKPITRDQLMEKETQSIHEVVSNAMNVQEVSEKKEPVFTDWRIHIRDESKNPLDGKVWLVDSDRNELTLPQSTPGNFRNKIQSKGDSTFELKIEASGYESYSSIIHLGGTSSNTVLEQTISLKKKASSIFNSLNLFYETNVVVSQNQSVLDVVSSMMRENKLIKINISGHTDNFGGEAYNTALSKNRAEAARKYLIRSGIDPSRIQIAGYGASKPLADNATNSGRKLNRRTEIEFVNY
jgi:outer membrane protein OmpA-like peptidoglycan-associated protein